MDKIKEVEVEIFGNLEEANEFGDLKQTYKISHFYKFIDMAMSDVTKKFIKNVIENLIYENLLEEDEGIEGLNDKPKTFNFKHYKSQIRELYIKENLTPENIIEVENIMDEFELEVLNNFRENISIAVINNISENKKIEKELRESEEKYKTLLNMLPDPVYVISQNLIQYANNAALEMFGVKSLDAVVGKELSYFLKVPIKYQSLVQQQDDILKRTCVLTPVERKYIRKSDNKYLDIEATAAIIKNQDRELILNVSRDIEVRKKIEKLKQRVNEKSLKLKEATRYDEIKNEFFANISHEFRTPINVILGVIQLFEKADNVHDAYEVQEKLRKYIGITKQNCYRLIRLVNNLIDITKIDAGHLRINLVRLDIVNLIESICMSVVEYMKTKGIELIFDTDIEELEICVDPDKIERIMLNLLSNAIKFTNANGQVFINLYYDEGYIDIVVRDTGIGIPKEKQKEIFNRFVQVERTLSRNREGSGIGLSLVKAFVEMHNGELILNSEVGKGSEFIIKIPVSNEESECKRNDDVSIQCGNIESINIEFSDIYS